MLYEEQIKSHFSTDCESAHVERGSSEPPEITVDEEHIILYVAGYVPYKLLKRYEQQTLATAQYYEGTWQ